MLADTISRGVWSRPLATRRAGARLRMLVGTVIALVTFLCALAPTALADLTTTFSDIETIPVPPASNYAGSGGGDGWAVALSKSQVFNAFHHNSRLEVVCHNQSDASTCWGPDVITDGSGNNFATGGQPGLFLDQNTGKLYVYATRQDGIGGVVCVDTTVGATNPNPFCGFTALTGVGEASLAPGWGELTGPMLVGSHWYSFNYVPGQNVNGAQNKLLCFDTVADSACAGQPFQVSFSSAGTMDYRAPSPGGAAIGTKLIIPVSVAGTPQLACFDDSAQTSCGGSWPAAAPPAYVGSNGSPFPMVDATGAIKGVCLPNGIDSCYALDGSTVPTPPEMTSAIGTGSTNWDGPGLQLGARVYVPAWSNIVYCYDAATQASCANFPKSFQNLGLLYTVNPDPQRPACVWVNSDDGSAQIQNFDAYTGGPCGQGSIRVLASQFVVPLKQCVPVSYQSLQILAPDRSTYTSGSVQFEDGDGNPIPGIGTQPLDGAGAVELNGLSLGSATGLPQFLITLTGESGTPGEVVVKLTWTSTYDASCVRPTTVVAQLPTTLATSLSGGGQSGSAITVPTGTPVTDQASLSGRHAAAAGGSVRYTWYAGNACGTAASTGAPEAITTPGSLPASAPVTLSPGTYHVITNYSGDGSNFPSESRCGDETVVVTQPPVATQAASTWTLTVALAGNGKGSISDLAKTFSCRRGVSADAGAASTCSHVYPAGTVVTLREAPAAGSKFDGWRIPGCHEGRTCQVTLNADTTITALFGKVIRKAPLLRIGDVGGGPGTGAGKGIVITPAQPGCATEIAFIASVLCNEVRADVSGRIGEHATGKLLVRIYSWLGMREAQATIKHGHWHARLELPGTSVGQALYLIVIHYGGDATIRAGTIAEQVSVEVER